MKPLTQIVLKAMGAALENKWLWVCLPFCLVLFMAVEVLARAGGGGNYSGSSGGGGGGGGDIGALVYLVFAYPEVGIPVVIIVIVAKVIQSRLNPDNTTSRAVKKLEQLGKPSLKGLANIKAKDQNFDEALFLKKAQKIDNAVQKAWTQGKMEPVRTFLSDGLMRRFTTQLGIMNHQGIRNAMADHQIIRSVIHSVEHDRHFDTIHVAIEATARDVEVDASLSFEQAQAKAQKARVEQYTEIWSFLRKPTAKTLSSDGAVDGQCPNCGAPVGQSQSSKCDHCDAIINSGQYDWVLAEITQPIEWKPSSTGQVSGLDNLTAVDPAFNRQAAEDRASFVFWRWIEALVTAKSSPLAKTATKEFQASVARLVSEGPKRHFKTAVGSVDLISVEHDVEGRDRFYAKILWSSAYQNNSAPAHNVSIVVLSRSVGAHDNGGLSYARCPVCQGPLSENDSPTCDYCGADLAAGQKDWVLENVLRPEEMRAVSQSKTSDEIPTWATPDMGNQRERTLLLMRMAAVVMADGVITKRERKLLKSASKRWSVPMEAVTPILEGQVDPNEVATMAPSNPQGFLSGLISAALIDGRIDKKEEKLLIDVARNLGIQDNGARHMMDSMTAKLKTR